ncbi:1-aminocyclopropane-1-carboxylate synthase 1 protein [Rutstroemia sp. NJR-2017a WRK4]|nr:1-aminocyclopropane-1-carboxylate synthase 1 protein [Rutstroemia sp. NJR-2017a WRK4]
MASSEQQKEDLGLSARMSAKLAKLPPPAYLAIIPPPGLVRLEQAENTLLRPELVKICKNAINDELDEETFNYPKGFGGEPKLRDGLASFFNSYFEPSLKVEADHISVSAGSGNSFDALLHTICDDGDIVLTPGPFWSGFSIYSTLHASATILPSPAPSFRNSLTPDVITRLNETYTSHPTPSRIKALLICNPHNPCDDTYSPAVLRQLMDFAHQHNLHYISDEVSALCAFNTNPEKPFVSALSLVRDGEGIRRSRVHVIWSASKDFGSAGVRTACVISQANPSLLAGITYSSLWQVSILSSIYVTALLTSPELPNLISLNKSRLKSAYEYLTTRLDEWGVEYIPVKAGMLIFVRIAKNAQTFEEEAAVVGKLKESGVLVQPGKMWGGIDGEKGWVRFSFAVKEEVMRDALERMGRVLGK